MVSLNKMSANNPFQVETTLPFVAILGERNGYVQVACSRTQEKYQHLNGHVLRVALDWCRRAELEGAERVYWITLSEMVRHLHIHLYPRWEADTIRGIALFEARNEDDQPAWTPALSRQVQEWARRHDVHIINPQMLYNRPGRTVSASDIASNPTPPILFPLTMQDETESPEVVAPAEFMTSEVVPPLADPETVDPLSPLSQSDEALPTPIKAVEPSGAPTEEDALSETVPQEGGFWSQVRQSPLSVGGGVLGLAGLATAFSINQAQAAAHDTSIPEPVYPPSSVSPLDTTSLDEPLPPLEVAPLVAELDSIKEPVALALDTPIEPLAETPDPSPVLAFAPGPWASSIPVDKTGAYLDSHRAVANDDEVLLETVAGETSSQEPVPTASASPDEWVSPEVSQVDRMETRPEPSGDEPMAELAAEADPPSTQTVPTVPPVDVVPALLTHYTVTQPVMPIALTAHWKAKPKAAAAKYGHAPISYPVWMINHSRHLSLMAQASPQHPEPASV
jgi:hypothetical protein